MNRESYNNIAHEWAEIRNKSFVSKLVKDFATKTKPGGEVLDIGCGTGYPLAKYLCERGFHLTGIDFSEQMIEIAQSHKLANAEFMVCDFFDFATNNKFDGILAWDSFFHFPYEKQKDIYHKVGNLLKPDGYLLFTHGNADDEHVDHMMGEPFYYSCLSQNQLSQVLDRAGFEIEFAQERFMEQNTDRDLVVLARKR